VSEESGSMTYRKIAGIAALLTAAALGASVPSAARAAAPANSCGGASTVKETLPNGTTWQLCWRIHDKAGLVLTQVYVSTRRQPEPVQVLDSIRLAQLHVPYDTGDIEYDDLTDIGMGGSALETLNGDDCKGGSARLGSDGSSEPAQRKVLCVSAEPSGLAYRAREESWGENGPEEGTLYSKQGHDLVLRVISKLSWYEYVTEYRLRDDGEISARLGATGDLAPGFESDAARGWPIGTGGAYKAAMHYHNAFWRVDFNLDGKGGEQVQQYDTKLDGQGEMTAKVQTTKTAITTEGTFSKVDQRWWRLASRTSKNTDGHPRSYELVTGGNDRYQGHPETKPDITFSEKSLCEKWASGNDSDPECPPDIRTVVDFVKDKQKLTDPVMWVRVGFHHIPRDEDQSPMPMHWQGFDLVPRDFTAMNPLTPDGRTGQNGNPEPEPEPSGVQPSGSRN
jgi:primary-amine oxidase